MPLISESYRQQNQSLHKAGAFGTMGAQYAPLVAQVINRMEVGHVLDYGCGAEVGLARTIADKKLVKHKFKYQCYDPAVDQFAEDPVPAEMVVCLDVLEHIEPDSIDEVLDHLYTLTEAVGFFSLCCKPAMKTLPDGRNAHLIVEPPEWWLPRIMARFQLQTFQVTKTDDEGDVVTFFVVVTARTRAIETVEGQKAS